jgi:hypothetical protein
MFDRRFPVGHDGHASDTVRRDPVQRKVAVEIVTIGPVGR